MTLPIAKRIAQDLNITPEDFEQRKLFLEIGPEDVERIKGFSASLEHVPGAMFDAFYEHLTAFPETKGILRDNTTIDKLKGKQLNYFEEMLRGDYDWDYLMSRLSVGWRHTELGIVPLWYIGAFGKYLKEMRKVLEIHSAEPEAVYESLFKVVLLDMIITLEAYHYGKYRLQEELKRAMVTDDLTGTYNRRKFEELMGFEIDRSRRRKSPLTMLMLDIDHFKLVNDTYGHHVGDEVLKGLAQVVGDQLREGDFLIRFGGEEFVVFLPDASLVSGVEVAERIRAKVEAHSFGEAGQVTISLGAAALEPYDTGVSFLERVDAKLYEAKEGGRNQVRS